MAKPRVFISTDFGGSDPDDQESLAHALLYADKFKIEGIVSTPTKHAGRAWMIKDFIEDVYAKDYSKLKTWSSDFPSPDHLKSVTYQGQINPQPSAGYSGSPSEGSKAIIKAAHASSEPLWVMCWGAMTDLAQALHDDPSIASKIKVYSSNGWNGTQDPYARDYIYNNFKSLWWIESRSTHRGMYVNEQGQEGNGFNMNDAKGHGALGDYFYKVRPWGIKMGDTPSILRFLDKADDNNPSADGWGGAFKKTGHGPNYWTDNPDPALKLGPYNGARTVYKHQAEIYADMKARFDWAKSANPNAGSGGGTTPPPTPGGNPVEAVTDTYKIAAGATLWENSRYLTANDIGKDGGLTVTAVDKTSDAGGTISWAADGTMTYKPKAGFQGVDRFNYVVRDKDGSTDTGTVEVTVGSGSATPPPPATGGTGNPVEAVTDSKYKIAAGGTLYENSRYLLANDKGADGGLHVASVAKTSEAGGTVGWAADGTMVYKPKAGFEGVDRFTYVVKDKDGSADTGTVEVTVGSGTASPPPPPPSGGSGNPVEAVTDSKYKIAAGGTLYENSRYLTWNDKGADGGLTVTQIDKTSEGGGTVAWGADGTMVYRPKAGFEGVDRFAYTVRDKDGSADVGTVEVTVGSGVSSPPGGSPTPPASGSGSPVVASDDFYRTDAGKTLYFNSRFLTANDKAPDGGLNVVEVGPVSQQGVQVSWGPEGSAQDGTVVYKPKAGWQGVDRLDYTVVDKDGSADVATVYIGVGKDAEGNAWSPADFLLS